MRLTTLCIVRGYCVGGGLLQPPFFWIGAASKSPSGFTPKGSARNRIIYIAFEGEPLDDAYCHCFHPSLSHLREGVSSR